MHTYSQLQWNKVSSNKNIFLLTFYNKKKKGIVSNCTGQDLLGSQLNKKGICNIHYNNKWNFYMMEDLIGVAIENISIIIK